MSSILIKAEKTRVVAFFFHKGKNTQETTINSLKDLRAFIEKIWREQREMIPVMTTSSITWPETKDKKVLRLCDKICNAK